MGQGIAQRDCKSKHPARGNPVDGAPAEQIADEAAEHAGEKNPEQQSAEDGPDDMAAPVRGREFGCERQNQVRHDSRKPGREARRVDQCEIRRHRHHDHRRA